MSDQGIFSLMLAEARHNFRAAPRKFTADEMNDLRVRPPAWMQGDRNDRIWEQYRSMKAIMENGQVVWGFLIQANQVLFQEDSEDAPAAWLYSTDSWFEEDVDGLAEIAHGLFETKGQQTGDPEVQRFADMLHDEHERQLRLPIPKSMTGGRPATYTCGMVVRSHLPVPFLADSLFPLVIAPRYSEATWILPSRFWPEPMLTEWFKALDG
ncbi:MAG: hypothetical protein H6840_04420 [Planctomycetes bacterium]|nr:hypothetical protein [Planctomycetota bacterium]